MESLIPTAAGCYLLLATGVKTNQARLYKGDSSMQVDASNSVGLAFRPVSDREKIFLRVTPDQKRRWIELCESKNIDQTAAGAAMLEWFLSQDGLLQSVIMKQIEPTDSVIGLISGGLSKQKGQPFKRAAKERPQ